MHSVWVWSFPVKASVQKPPATACTWHQNPLVTGHFLPCGFFCMVPCVCYLSGYFPLPLHCALHIDSSLSHATSATTAPAWAFMAAATTNSHLQLYVSSPLTNTSSALHTLSAQPCCAAPTILMLQYHCQKIWLYSREFLMSRISFKKQSFNTH